jgi:hypothetical protein
VPCVDGSESARTFPEVTTATGIGAFFLRRSTAPVYVPMPTLVQRTSPISIAFTCSDRLVSVTMSRHRDKSVQNRPMLCLKMRTIALRSHTASR